MPTLVFHGLHEALLGAGAPFCAVALAAPEPDPPAEDPPSSDADEPAEVRDGERRVVVVHDEDRPRELDRGASHFEIDRELLEAAPHFDAGAMLATAPGVFVARGEGGAVAQRYMLRGFDADHGQDIEMRVGGLPINLPSHVHGQGYADLGLLIPEVVDDIHVTEGVYDPRQGDFAVAGTFDIHLGVHRRGWRASSGYGRFGTFRQLALWAPRDAHEQTFAAVHYGRSDGFGPNRRGQDATAIVQTRLGRSGARWGHRLLGIAHAARYEHAGVVRVDDVEAGRADWFGPYPLATARAQDASNMRVLIGEESRYAGPRGENADVGVWIGYDAFRVLENFTGFTQTSVTLPDVAGRGDLIEQLNHTFSAGLSGRYRSRPYRVGPWASTTVELGTVGRFDRIDQSQSLVDASVRHQTWDRRIDALVHGVDVGLYSDLDWQLGSAVRLRVGGRADALFYDVDDRLGNLAPSVRPDDVFITGYRRSAAGVAAGPRTSAEVRALPWLSVRGAYGEGYRSPQARSLENGERAPFTKVRSADLGVRLAGTDRHALTVSGYWTRLSDDVAFDAEAGRLERVGATRRVGAVVHAQTRPAEGIIGAVSVTYVDAELLEPPPATAEDPDPAFTRGQNLPFVPPLVVRADLGVDGPLARRGGPWELTGRLGVGFSFLSPRPLAWGGTSDPVPLLDASAGLAIGPFDLSASFFNLLDRRWAAVEYAFPSHWDPEGVRPRTPARHIAAGAPFSFLFTLGVSL